MPSWSISTFLKVCLESSAKSISVSTDSTGPGALSEEFLELANGCLCCSIKDVGLASIEKLMEKKGAFDYILLETTGLADPGAQDSLPSPSLINFTHPCLFEGPIAANFWHNEELATGLGRDICLDGVVCVVDSVFGEKVSTADSSSQ